MHLSVAIIFVWLRLLPHDLPSLQPHPSPPIFLPFSPQLYRLYALARSPPSPHASPSPSLSSPSRPAAADIKPANQQAVHHKRSVPRHATTAAAAADVNIDILHHATNFETRANLLSSTLQGAPHIETPRILAAPLPLPLPPSRSSPLPPLSLQPKLKSKGRALAVAAAEHTAHLFAANRYTRSPSHNVQM